ncbi:MAG TPA: cupin domain-containing protein, partial [Ilumatobacter sp.]|nr:cupin domain-containing protein [Ilumatobacter sp.]
MPDLQHAYCYFLEDDKFVDTERPGFRRRVVTGDHLQMCFWRIAGGATGSFLHHHAENEQLGMVLRGSIRFRVGAEERNLGPGETWEIPSKTPHRAEAGPDGATVLDIFAPPRSEW